MPRIFFLPLMAALVVNSGQAVSSGVRQVWHHNHLLFGEAASFENREYQIPMKQTSQFIADVGQTEMLVAVAVLQLVQDGKMQLDGLATGYLGVMDMELFSYTAGESTWCPQWQGMEGTCQPITIRHLLSMTSGIRAASSHSDSEARSLNIEHCFVSSRMEENKLALLVSSFLRNPTVHQAGEGYLYAHENYVLLAYLVEKISGLRLKEYMHRYVFQQLKMESTFFNTGFRDIKLSKETSSYIEYYEKAKEGVAPSFIAEGSCQFLENKNSHSSVGNLVTTIPDMSRMYMSLFDMRNASSVLLPASISMMLGSHSITPGHQCLMGADSPNFVCKYGLGIKLLYRASDQHLLAYGTDTTTYSSCFWSSIVVYNDTSAPNHPLVLGAFTNNRSVFIERSEWTLAVSQEAKGQEPRCLVCNASVVTDDSSLSVAITHSSMDIGDETAESQDKSSDIGESPLDPGLVVTVVLVPVFLVTVVWLLIVTDYHRDKVLKLPLDQATRIARAQSHMRSESQETPVDDLEYPYASNPMNSEHGNNNN